MINNDFNIVCDEVKGQVKYNPNEQLQILKRHVNFRNVNDIKDENDIDAVILPKWVSNFFVFEHLIIILGLYLT